MIPQGKYRARGVEGALGLTGTGKEQVGVLLEVIDGEHQGTQLTWYGFFTEKTTERTFESLRYLGWQGDDLTDLTGIDANEVSIVIEHEPDQSGELRARVKWINAGGSGLVMKDRMDAAAARAFSARMKGLAVASRQRSGAPQQQRAPQTQQRQPEQRRQPSTNWDDDKIPF